MEIIQVSQLTKTFETFKKEPGLKGALKHVVSPKKIDVTAVNTISFSIKKGEFVGFIGKNGAGKTTTLKMLSGILNPTSGQAMVAGFTPWKRELNFKRKFALVMGQKNQLWWDLPVRESYELLKVMYEIPEKRYKENVNKLGELLSIQHLFDVQVRKMSLGERMKCELLGALLHDPEILFLDEPTIGLDIVSQNNIRAFLREYNKESNATIILTSHYMEDIERLCERMIIIDAGQILYDGGFEEFRNKYSDVKVMDLTFKEPISKTVLEKYGKVIDFSDGRAKIEVKKSELIEKSGSALRALPLLNISIHERSLEECLHDLF